MRTYTIVVELEEVGGYFVTVPPLPGCVTRASVPLNQPSCLLSTQR
jgi:hypothetical protein